VKCSSNFTVFLTASGKVYTCGAGANGRLGHGNEEGTTLPTLIQSLEEKGLVIQHFDVGGNHVSAIDWDGKCYAWGFNQAYQLGVGHNETILNPALLKTIEHLQMVQVGCGESHTAFATVKGEVYTCGWGHFCGHGDKENVTVPTKVQAMDGKCVRQLECGRSQSTVVTDIGEVWNWGIGACGQLGHGHDEDDLLPAIVLNIQEEGICKISAGALHMMVLTDWDQHCLHMQDTGFASVDLSNRLLLHRGVLTNNFRGVQYLIAQGTNYRATDNLGQTVLHICVHCGQEVVLKYLLEVTDYECFDTKDKKGRDVMELAMLMRQYLVASILINYFANNYARGRIQQAVAAVNNANDLLQMTFTDMQPAVTTDLLYNRNPLYWAAAFGRIEATKLLATNPLWINERDFRGQTPLYLAVFGDTMNHVECAKILLEHEARLYFVVPDHYGKQPGDYADYPPMIEMLAKYVQITLCMEYEYQPQVVSKVDLADYLSCANICAKTTGSQRQPEHLVMQIDVEGDDELDVDDAVLAEFRNDADKGIGSFKILVSPSTDYDPPVPDELQWESGFWTNELVRFGGIDVMCNTIALHERDLTALATEFQRIEKHRDIFNLDASKLVAMDIKVLEEELGLKQQRMDGIEEDLEEAEEESENLNAEKMEVEQRLEALQERLDFYDNQMEAWEGRVRASVAERDSVGDAVADANRSTGRASTVSRN